MPTDYEPFTPLYNLHNSTQTSYYIDGSIATISNSWHFSREMLEGFINSLEEQPDLLKKFKNLMKQNNLLEIE